MVGVLISMKFAMLRNSPRGMRIAGWVLGGLLVLGSWAAVVGAADAGVRAEVLMLVGAAWTVGAVLGPVSMSGAGVLRPEHFALLPLDRRRLALGLLAATFPGVASAYVLLVALAVLVLAATSGTAAAAVLVGLLGAVLAWAVALTASRVVYALLGAAMRTRLGVEISAVQFGLIIAGMFAGWVVISQASATVPELLRDGVGPAAAGVLGWLPSSWPVLAVVAAEQGRVLHALGWLGALALVLAVLLLAAAALLRVDLDGGRARTRGRPLGSRVLTGPTLLPTTSLGAVAGKELRQWWRDPWRSLEIRSAIWTGIFVGVFTLTAPWAREFAPLSGLFVAFMIALGGCNLYGQDGSALWLSVVGQRADTVRAEVRGRQLALLLIFAPPTVVVTAALVLLTRAWWAWPVVGAMIPALLGVACGVAVLLSAVGVSPGVDPRRRTGPNDAGGDLGLQIQVAIWSTTALVAPTLAVVVLGVTGALGYGGVPWWAFGVGALNGVVGYLVLGRLTMTYLQDRLPVVFSQIRYRRRDDDHRRSGLLVRLSRMSQKGEDTAREAKEKEKQERAGARG